MLAKERHIYTPGEYLALEEQADYKSEYHRGQIIALAGASINHNRIAVNLGTELVNALGTKPCQVFISDLRLWVDQADCYTYPDVMVICGEAVFVEGRTDTVTNPKVIVEVLSESTIGYDKGDKFYAYWTLNTLEEYVLVDQYQCRVEYFRRVDEKKWELRVFTRMNDSLDLKSIEVTIPLAKIYRNVTWNETAEVV